jgi:hypothetical protein
MKKKSKQAEEEAQWLRHRRKCVVCHHPDREAIEEEYVHWYPVSDIARYYDISDYRSIRRHAHAAGLIFIRRRNLASALDHILSQSVHATVSADSVINAIRAYSSLTKNGRWIDRPARVIHSVLRPSPAPRPKLRPQPIRALRPEQKLLVGQKDAS